MFCRWRKWENWNYGNFSIAEPNQIKDGYLINWNELKLYCEG